MTTFRRSTIHPARSTTIGLALLAAVMIAGCSAAAAPSAAPPSTAPASVAPSQAPSDDPNASVGSGVPVGGDPTVVDPDGRLVTPKPGQLDVHPIPAERLTAAIDGRKVTVTVAYTSGVEPCYVLDSIVVAVGADAQSFAITLREGHGPGDVACIEIAETKRTVVDLGELAAGTYSVTDATGGAAPITVIVP